MLLMLVLDRRRHQRIRFAKPPVALIGCDGRRLRAEIENISATGLMLRTSETLPIGRMAGLEFRLGEAPLIDVAMAVVSRVGDLVGGRFQAGPVVQSAIEEAVLAVLANGQGSVLGVHEVSGRKVLRIAGGLNASLRSDFMHALTRVGVDEIDLSEVTAVDDPGLSLCLIARDRQGVPLVGESAVLADALARANASAVKI